MDEAFKVVSKLAIYPDPVLLKRTELVTDFSSIPALAEMMFDTMLFNYGAGLAANQVKLSIRMFVLRTLQLRQAFINPKILQRQGTMIYKERCLSFPGVVVEKKRSSSVSVESQDIFGNTTCITLEGLEAIIAQHEIEHLDGQTFIDDLSRTKRQLICQRVKKQLKRRK